jgi:hypothetical protein
MEMHVNAQDLMTTSVVSLATDSRIRIEPDEPLPLGGGSVTPNLGVRSAGRARKDAKSSIQHAMLAAMLLVAGTSSAAFGDETSPGVKVLRGTPPRVEQPQKPQPVQVPQPPLECDQNAMQICRQQWDYCSNICSSDADVVHQQTCWTACVSRYTHCKIAADCRELK